uniref:hypothetical protein n=1 Tax=Agathobacter sp. TaxID=2021311 RepID=UPI004057B211
MANFEIPENVEFNSELRMIETIDRAHADLFNGMFGQLLLNEVFLKLFANAISEKIINHMQDMENPHTVTTKQLALEKVNNTSDADKPVSIAQQQAISEAERNAKTYTDTKIADLIGGAPSTLDTLKEIADAMAENIDVVKALNEAIGTKANESDFTAHIGNTMVHITSAERTNWNDAYSKRHTHSNKTVLDNTTASFTTEEKEKLAKIATGANAYTHPNSGVTAGTYRSVTVNADGHVTAGSNPTTLAGYGITDAAAKSHTHDVPGYPDYKNRKTLISTSSVSGSATISADGFVQYSVEAGSNNNNVTFKINDVIVEYVLYVAKNGQLFPVKAGDMVSFSGATAAASTVRFYPLR